MKTSPVTGFLLMSFLALKINAASINSDVSASSRRFIVGGTEAERNEFPWLVNLAVITNDGIYLCGGTLIRLDVVLTSAHCLRGDDVRGVQVTAGDHNLAILESTEQKRIYKSIRIHEDYRLNKFGRLMNDIALIGLDTQFIGTEAVSTIGLPAPDAIINATSTSNGTAAGWGTIKNGTVSDVLMKVDVPIVTDASCTSRQSNSETQFCTGTTGKNSCQGDAGGPFLCHDLPGQVCGIMSYGYGYGLANYTGVYTKVSSFIEWINKNIPT